MLFQTMVKITTISHTFVFIWTHFKIFNSYLVAYNIIAIVKLDII